MISFKSMAVRKKIVFFSLTDLNLLLFRLPIMQALVSAGFSVVALTPPGERSDEFSQYGIEFVPYPLNRKSLNPFVALQNILNLVFVLRRIQPDILQTFTVKPNIFGAIAGRLAGVRYIGIAITGMGSFFIENTLKARSIRLIILMLYKLACYLANVVIFQNQDDLNYFSKLNFVNRDKGVLIKGSGIDTTLWTPEERDHDGVVTVIMIGRLLIHKGIYDYIEMSRALRLRYGNRVRCLLVGDYDTGSLFGIPPHVVDAAIADKAIDYLGIRFDIRMLLQQSDIFVLPSYREGIPRSGIEAASMGLPIVTTDAVGCREVVDDGQNGFTVPIQAPDALIDGVSQLIDNPELRRTMGINSRKKAIREFDISNVVAEYLAHYTSGLNSSAREK